MHVLIVDDDDEVRGTMRLMLEEVGFEVTEATDGAKAVLAYRLRQADVVFCDMFMPGTDGLEAIRALRGEFPGVKVIAMSGGGFSGTVDMLTVARQLGASGVLDKPFHLKPVLAALQDLKSHSKK